MTIVRTVLLAVLLSAVAVGARASVVTFNLTGVPGISGFVQYDSSFFHGFTFDYVPNSAIVGLDIDVFGAHFDLGDLVNIPGFSAAFIDTVSFRIINGFGLLADNGVNGIAYFPDGWDNTPLDGDAALSFQTTCCFFPVSTYAVQWVATVPEAPALALLAVGLVALALWRPR